MHYLPFNHFIRLFTRELNAKKIIIHDFIQMLEHYFQSCIDDDADSWKVYLQDSNISQMFELHRIPVKFIIICIIIVSEVVILLEEPKYKSSENTLRIEVVI